MAAAVAGPSTAVLEVYPMRSSIRWFAEIGLADST